MSFLPGRRAVHEKCLNEAQRLLATDKDVIVPVKKLWRQVTDQGKKQQFEVASLPDFTALLEADPRFEFLPAHSTIEDDLSEPPDAALEEFNDQLDQLEQMEQMGFYSGDRVKLRAVQLTPEIVGGIIRSKLDRTMDALTKAWDQRPKDDAETEETLRVILDKAQELQRDVNEAFSEDRMKELSKVLKRHTKKAAGTKKTSRPSQKRTVTKRKKPGSRPRPSSLQPTARRKPAPSSPRRRKRR
jgi:hypothetical protein